MKNNDNKGSIVLLIFVIVCVLGVIYIPRLFKGNGEGMSTLKLIEKDYYGVNEYIPVYVDDEQMSKKYLQDYINSLIYDMDGSYKLLDKEYREEKFGNIYNYKYFIDSLNISTSAEVAKYAVYERFGYKYYDLYDKDGHRFIFKTDGVLQYKVYFDDIDEGEEE